MNKDIELTEKELYCIARHIQVYVLRNENEVIKKEDNPCCRCECRFECYEKRFVYITAPHLRSYLKSQVLKWVLESNYNVKILPI